MKNIIFGCIATFASFFCYSQKTIPIPDIAFEEALIDLQFDSNGLNGNILASEAELIVNLNIENPLENKLLPNVFSKIRSLSGIEHFKNLKRLNCFGNAIKKLDLSKNTELTFLNCSYNKIKKLDLTNNPNLFSVSCENNKLTSLTLGNKPELTQLFCNNNKITELDLSSCNSLTDLDASSNKIKVITIKKTVETEFKDRLFKDDTTTFKSTE